MENKTINNELEFNLKYFPDKFVSKTLPVKKVLLQSKNVDQIFYPEISGATTLESVHHCLHNESEFNIFCLCEYCLDYRNDILEIFNDYDKTQKIWEIFHTAFSKFYVPLVEKVPQEIRDQYTCLMSKSSNWFVNGTINNVKQKHIDFILDFPWTDKMIVVIFSTILTEDDPHQLFELTSFIVECFVKQYAAALTTNFQIVCDSISASKFLLTYILTGYEKLCAIADLMSDMLFVFENNLEKMKCSWILLNKKMYEKYFYSIVRTIIPEFIIKLKEELSTYEYNILITKFKKFEMDMTLTENSWQEINLFLQIYENSEENHIRKTGIKYIKTIFNNIYENCQLNTNEVDSSQKVNDVSWDEMISSIKKNWNNQEKGEKIKVIIEENECQHCQFLLHHNKTFSTSIIGLKYDELTSKVDETTIQPVLCIKCSFMEILKTKDSNFVTRLSEMSLNDKSINIITAKNGEDVIENFQKESTLNLLKNEEYHYCWAVFKHLKDRKPYQSPVIDPSFFCKNCQRTPCFLAKKILNKEISNEVVRYLLKYYQPFAITNEEIMQMLPKIWLCFKKGHFPHDNYDEDFVIRIFWIFVISAYATCFANLDNIKSIPPIDGLTLKNNDIELSFSNKELNLESSGLLEFIEKIINLLQANNSNQKMPNDDSKDMNLSSLIYSNTDNNKDDLSYSSKEVSIKNNTSDKVNISTRNVCKSDIIENVECKNSAKDASSSKPTCFHEKEYRHSRKYETRDRLRKKLKNLDIVDKKPPFVPQEIEESVAISNNNNLQGLCSSRNATVQNNKNISNNNYHDKNNIVERSIVNISDISTGCEKKITGKTSRDEKWVKDALSYIEGSKNEINVVNNKKAAKRQKQKMKKEESKRIEEIKDLRSQFHEIYFKEFMAKKERKNEQLSKKKDKKRILELENSVKKLSKIKLRIEKDILELISTLKSINSEFKFTYLPTKEQQEEFLQNTSHVQDSISNCYNTNDKIKTQQEIIVPTKTSQRVPICEQNEFINLSKTEGETEMTDASKRIVTIRRVNMLNNNEPQVTVTAKGSSPDEDKVLYTFINGRLVHRDSGNISQLENSPRINFTQLSEIRNALFQNNNIMSCIDNYPNSANIPPNIKTKTQLKKDRKLAKQKIIEKLNEEKRINLKTNTQVMKKEYNLKNLKPFELQIVSNNEPTNSSNKCKQKKENSKCNQNIQKELKNHEIQNKSKSNCKLKTQSTSQQNTISKSCEKTITNEKNINIIKKTDKEKKKIRPTYNTKIMENNQFNLLNIDDNDSFTEESESDTDTDTVICKKQMKSLESKCILNKNKSSSRSSIIKSKIEESSPGLKKKVKCKDRIVNNKKNSLKCVKDNAQYSSNFINISKPPEKKIFGLEESMNSLNLNANNDNLMKKNDVNNISIMEQLKRGIQVENLMLPPGITLTKVNSAKAEELKAKTTSINNLSKQMLPPQPPPPVHSMFNTEHLLTSDFISPTVNKFLTDTRGVIMVDNISPKPVPQKNVPQCVNETKNKTKLKKRKRIKSKSTSEAHIENKNVASNVITLRNPMFYLSNQEGIPYCNLTDRLPQNSDPQIDQPATIIRNKNGMFTIRNPVLYQNMAQSNQYNNNYGGFSPNYYTLRSYQQNGDCSSYLSDNASNNSGKCISAHQKQCTAFQNKNFNNQNFSTDSCNYVNGLKSFVPPDSVFYNNYGNYCGSTAPVTKNNTLRNPENLQQNTVNKNGTNIQNNNVQIRRLLDLKQLSNEVTIENSFTSKGLTQLSNQGDDIEIQNSRSNELGNQHFHNIGAMLSDK